jgi:glutathione gamma-glutamylcysteinyltransferase
LFSDALLQGTLQGYFRLAQQFHTQGDPASCGLGSLVCALNALRIDPRRKWKGVWRWFSEELLDCCKSLDDARRLSLTLDEVACLATCSAATVSVHRPPLADANAFREHLRAATMTDEGPVLIVNYSRRAVGQSGDGHFSPIAAYHAATDSAMNLEAPYARLDHHLLKLTSTTPSLRARCGRTPWASGRR